MLSRAGMHFFGRNFPTYIFGAFTIGVAALAYNYPLNEQPKCPKQDERSMREVYSVAYTQKEIYPIGAGTSESERKINSNDNNRSIDFLV